jgi:hypothetical protein
MPEEGEQMPEKEPPLLPSSVNRPDVPAGSNVPERYHSSDIIPPGLIKRRPEETEESSKATIQEEINRIYAQRIEKRRMARERFPKKEEPTPSPQAEEPSTRPGAKTEQPKTNDEAAQQKGKESAKTEEAKQKTKQNRVERALDWVAEKLDKLAENPIALSLASMLGYETVEDFVEHTLRRTGKKARETARDAANKAAEKLASRKQRGKKGKREGEKIEEAREEEFEEAPQEKPEREVRPSRIPILVIPKAEKEEKAEPEKEGGRNFIDIQEEILNFQMPSTSASEEEKFFARQRLDQLFNERKEVYREVRDAGFYKDSVQQILLTLSVSKLGDVQRNIKILADSYENSARSSEKYTNNKRWHGIVRAGIMGAAVKIAADGYSTIIDDRDALAKDGMSVKGVEQLIQRANIEHFMGFGGVNPVDYVELNYKESEGEKIYKRLKEEGQGEKIYEKLRGEGIEYKNKIEQLEQKIRDLEQKYSQASTGEGKGLTDIYKEMRKAYVDAMKIAGAEEQEELYPNALKFMVPIPSMRLRKPEFLSHEWLTLRNIEDIQSQERIRSEWEVIADLSTACSNKLGSERPIHPNPEAQLITNKRFEKLLNKNGVIETLSLIEVFLAEDKEGTNTNRIRDVLLGDNPPTDPDKREEWERLRNVLPTTFFQYKDERKEEDYIEDINELDPNKKRFNKYNYFINNVEQFETFQESLTYWLSNKRGLDEEDTQMVVSIAWDFVYLLNLPEFYNSKYVHPDRKRLTVAIPQLRTTHNWETLRPQDRFDGKTSNGESWGPFGAWSINQNNSYSGWENPKVLPEYTVKSGFHYIETSDGIFSDVLHRTGVKLIENPNATVEQIKLGDDKEWIPWYQFLKLDPAQDLTEFITKMPNLDKDAMHKLGDLFDKLGLSDKEREILLMGFAPGSVNTKSRKLKPTMGGSWGGWKSVILKVEPRLKSGNTREKI